MKRPSLGGAFSGDLAASEPAGASKPGVPFLLPCALAAWAAAAGAYALLEPAGAADARTAAAAGALALALGAAIAWRTRRRAAFVAAFFALGAALGSLAAYSYHDAAEHLPAGAQAFEVRLVSDERASAFGSYCSAVCTPCAGRPFRATVFLDAPSGLLSGYTFRTTAKASPVDEEYAGRSYFSGEVAKLDVGSFDAMPLAAPLQALYDLRERAVGILGAHGGEQAGVLQALVCGYRGTIQEDGVYEAFKTCGLAHVVAVSGAHLAIVTMAFKWLLSLLRAGRRVQLAACAAFVVAYLVFAGIPISAVRAAAMVLASLFAGAVGRRNATLNSLAVCVLGFLVLDPASCVSVSLFLSAGSVLGIVLFSSLVASWMDPLPSLLRRALAEPVGLTVSSNVVTLPYSAAAFGVVPVLSVPANVAATPLFTAGCVCGLACTLASCALPAAAPVLVGAASAAAFPLRAFVEWMSALPFASIEASLPTLGALGASALAVCALWVAWPRVPCAAFSCMLALPLAAYVALALCMPPAAGEDVVMLDVGQGDAILVRSEGHAMLVDTGNEERMLRDALAAEGVRRLDAVAVTHPDADHCASLESLGSYASVGSFLCAEAMLGCGCAKCEGLLEVAEGVVGEGGVVGLAAGDVVTVGRFEVEVLWPSDFTDEGGNADSLCMMVRLDADGDGEADWRVLLTGDAEGEQLDALLARGLLEDIDVLKVGHHGSKAALTEASLRALAPELALVSCGERNSYGHPAPATLSALEDVGARVRRTDEEGTVAVTFRPDGMTVRP